MPESGPRFEGERAEFEVSAVQILPFRQISREFLELSGLTLVLLDIVEFSEILPKFTPYMPFQTQPLVLGGAKKHHIVP